MRALLRLRDEERGLTLVELLVYMVLISLVLIMVGNLMIQSLRVQHSTVSTNTTSNEAQAVLTSVELAVRNSTRIDVRYSGGNELLVVTRRSTTADANAGVCQAWFYDAGTSTLHAVTDAATGSPRSAAAWAGSTDPSGWPVVLSDVVPTDATMFASGATGPLTVGFRAETSRHQTPIDFTTTVRQRAGTPVGGVSCT